MSEQNPPGTTPSNGQVSQSELMYEPPSNESTFDFDKAGADFINSLVNGTEPADPDTFEKDPEMFGTDDEPKMPGEDDPAEFAETEAPEPEDEPEVEDPKFSRGIQRVVQRELAATERLKAAEAAEARAQATIAEAKKYENLRPTAEIAAMMDLDPIGAFKAMGKDPDTMIKLALAQQLGDSAPASLKEFAREATTKREIAQLRAQIAEQAQAQRANEYFNTIQLGAKQYVTSVGDSTPTLALVAKADPDYARDEIMEEIVSEAKRAAVTDPNGEPITYEEAAKRVETRLSKLAKLLSVQNSMNPANKNVKQPARVTPPATKSASKPLAPWARNSASIEEQGLAEAMRVYEQAEAARKQRR